MAKIQMFFKAVYAGFMIGAGCIVYLSVENKLAGSFIIFFWITYHCYTGILFVYR